MLRTIPLVLLALVLAPAALADGGAPSVVPGDANGTTSPRTPYRYVTLPAGKLTVVTRVLKRDGSIVGFRPLAGWWGTPLITTNGAAGGLSRDGKLLVVAGAEPQRTPLAPTTRFLVLETRGLSTHRQILLHGNFSFDALSPRARTMYLIQHVAARDVTRYLVRAYDMRAGRLLPGAIADKTPRGWTMAGSPVARAWSPDGRWAYTLYRQTNNYPFIHALDTVTRTAVCIAVPEHWNGNLVFSGGLQLDGHRLLISDRPGGPTRYVLDTTTFRVSAATAGRPVAFGAGVGGGALVFLVAAGLLARRSGPCRRRRRSSRP